MSKTIVIPAAKREVKGSAPSRRQRKCGIVPAVIYSRGAENELITISEDDAKKIQYHAGLVELTAEDGSKKDAIVKEMQINTITCKPLAVDFLEVKPGEKVTLTVPVEAIGEADGIKAGGQLEQVIHELTVNGTPADLPEVIKLDVTALGLGQALTIGDVKIDGITVEGSSSLIIFHVRAPHGKAAAAAAEEK